MLEVTLRNKNHLDIKLSGKPIKNLAMPLCQWMKYSQKQSIKLRTA